MNAKNAVILGMMMLGLTASAINLPPLNDSFIQDCEARGGTVEAVAEGGGASNDSGPRSDYPTKTTYVCAIPEKTASLHKCEDGTRYGRCSSQKPLYCEKNKLVPKCSQCGCHEGLECLGNECTVKQEAAEETPETTLTETTTIQETTTIEETTTVKPTTTEPTTPPAPPETTPKPPPTGMIIQETSSRSTWKTIIFAATILAAITIAIRHRKR